MNDGHESINPAGEWLKFGVLVAILFGTLIIIALVRPMIFGRIVPAVLGMDADNPTPLPVTVTVEPVITITPAGEPTPVPTDTATPEPPTPVPPVYHIVQPGENLTRIAARYGVTVDAIIRANQITNPNRIEVGRVLVIPQP